MGEGMLGSGEGGGGGGGRDLGRRSFIERCCSVMALVLYLCWHDLGGLGDYYDPDCWAHSV